MNLKKFFFLCTTCESKQSKVGILYIPIDHIQLQGYQKGWNCKDDLKLLINADLKVKLRLLSWAKSLNRKFDDLAKIEKFRYHKICICLWSSIPCGWPWISIFTSNQNDCIVNSLFLMLEQPMGHSWISSNIF